MQFPLHFLMRFGKVRGLSQALCDHVEANARLEKSVNSLEAKLFKYEQVVQLMAGELRALRNGQQHDLLPIMMFSSDKKSGETAKRIFSLLRPMDVVNGRLIRRGGRNDGGYVMLDADVEMALAYSLGISNDVAWDLDMAAAGYTVYKYDGSIASLPVTHPAFRWFKLMVGTRTGIDTITLADAIDRNGHSTCDSLVLKMDIETAEWDVFQTMSQRTLSKCSQIIVELHCVYPSDYDWMAKIEAVLCKLNRSHQVIHLHANNYGCLGVMGGVVMPGTFEVTYARRRDHEFTETKKVFPTILDAPCRADAPDFYLGPLGAVPEYVCS